MKLQSKSVRYKQGKPNLDISSFNAVAFYLIVVFISGHIYQRVAFDRRNMVLLVFYYYELAILSCLIELFSARLKSTYDTTELTPKNLCRHVNSQSELVGCSRLPLQGCSCRLRLRRISCQLIVRLTGMCTIQLLSERDYNGCRMQLECPVRISCKSLTFSVYLVYSSRVLARGVRWRSPPGPSNR